MQTFTFPYYTTKNSLTADEFSIKAQMGPLVKREFAPSDLLNFYHFKNKQYDALYATYNAEGKTKKIQLFSNLNEPQFAEMVQYFQQKYPSQSLNHLSDKEAFQAMHIANPNKWVPPFVFVLLAVSMTILFYPMLRHYFDKGFAQTTIDAYTTNPDIGTRNLTISGYPLDVGVKETITSSKGGSHSSTYIPIVGENWKEGDPVKVLLEFSGLSESGFDEVIKQTQFTGVIRNVWWEGISSDNVDFLKEKYKLAFNGTPTLIEVTGTTANDGFVIWVWSGTMVFILILVIIVAVKMKKK